MWNSGRYAPVLFVRRGIPVESYPYLVIIRSDLSGTTPVLVGIWAREIWGATVYDAPGRACETHEGLSSFEAVGAALRFLQRKMP